MIKRYNNNNISFNDDNKKIYFLSYESKIAVIEKGFLTLFEKWDYSQTTQKFLYKFLNDNINHIKDETQKHYILMCINSNNKKSMLQRFINLKYIKYKRS